MNIKRKGKVYPSPSSSSSYKDALSVLKLLPAAILALAAALSVEDREVLAYMMTRSLTIFPSSTIDHKKKCRRPNDQKYPVFECGCFDCYTTFWFRWDSSPNRELIHKAIEAFEDHLSNGEHAKKHSRGRKREKLLSARQSSDNMADITDLETVLSLETPKVYVPEGDAVAEVEAVEAADGLEENCEEGTVAEAGGNLVAAVATVQVPVSSHKGLARKVLPDVVGLFNSRLWSLWSPNI